MKAHEMRNMTVDELQQHHDKLVAELVSIKIKLAVKQLDNPLRVRAIRREIAQTKTVMREKQLSGKDAAERSAATK